jgi:hypothetical protein
MSTRARQFADSVSNLIEIASGDSTDFITPEILSASIASIDLSSAIITASAAAAGYTDSELENIDLTSTIITASAAAIDELDNRIIISSASPTLGNNDGRLWVDTSSASAPVLQTYGSGQFRKTIVNRTKALGGNITQTGPYTVHTFTGTGTFTALEPISVESLVLAGGGGGGSDRDVGGGGGGGGLRTSNFNLLPESYAVVVGSGGNRGTGVDFSGAGTGSNGTQGGNSSFNGIVSTGGGFGGTRNNNGGNGGSGGGGGDAARPGGTGIAGQGNSGGAGPGMNTQGGNDSGGGGGAGSAASLNIPGVGLSNSISGTAVTYAKGGRGSQNFTPFDAGVNTGDGGDGGRNGGSGIVIIRYLT